MTEIAKVKKLITRGALAGVSLASHAHAVGSESISPAVPAAEIEATGIIFADKVAVSEQFEETANSGTVVAKRTFIEPWDEYRQARFMELARKDALEGLTADEVIELRDLQLARERACAPRSFEEIERDFEIEEAVMKAINALDNLVKRASYRK